MSRGFLLSIKCQPNTIISINGIAKTVTVKSKIDKINPNIKNHSSEKTPRHDQMTKSGRTQKSKKV